MVDEWDIDILNSKIPIYMIIDNSRNLKCTFANYNNNDILYHYFYAAHTLQLSIEDPLKENNMGNLLNKCRLIVAHYNPSNKSC